MPYIKVVSENVVYTNIYSYLFEFLQNFVMNKSFTAINNSRFEIKKGATSIRKDQIEYRILYKTRDKDLKNKDRNEAFYVNLFITHIKKFFDYTDKEVIKKSDGKISLILNKKQLGVLIAKLNLTDCIIDLNNIYFC